MKTLEAARKTHWPRGLAALDAGFARYQYYAENVRGLRPNTIIWYARCYRIFRSFWLRHSALRGVAVIDAWIASARKRIAPITINHYFRGVRAFFNYHARHDSRFDNPFRDYPAPSFPATLPKALPSAQCRAVLEAARRIPWSTPYVAKRAVAIVATVLYTGLRRSELVGLTIADVDLVEGTVRVRSGKGGKERVAYIPPALDRILRGYVRARRRKNTKSDQFFISKSPNRALSGRAITAMFQRIREELGFPCSPHRLRHSFVTQLLKCGVPIHIASKLAGHENISTTMRYLRVWSSDQRKYAAMLKY